MFNEKDIKQIESKGLQKSDIKKQISNFVSGFPFIELTAPATKDNGIKVFSEDEVKEMALHFDQVSKEREIIKFVPASGAASRMFKHLYSFMEDGLNGKLDYNTCFEDKSFNSVYYFFDKLKDFAFFKTLNNTIERAGLKLEELLANNQHHVVLEYLLTDKGMNYAKKPKGLLAFHKYTDAPRFAVEEHLVEAAVYARDQNDFASVHFTVSPEHMKDFETIIDKRKQKYEEKYGVKFKVSYSVQKPSTDTIAVNPDNTPFREENGDLLFRPGGHGALIENVNDLKGDLIFIKNIDNVVPDALKYDTFLYKKALAGYLLKVEKRHTEIMEKLDLGNLSSEELDEIVAFAEGSLNIRIDKNVLATLENIEKVDHLFNLLNRPIRICGMVKNEGEPGGGPYWVKNTDDEISLQIVESSQMNLDDASQKEHVKKATHFNPVDLICSVRDFNGENFDLNTFVDPETGFISEKSKDGKTLKAQELPGLWNGAMAQWITIFAETPIITFNPVKTVNDLLREQHQPS